jgi:hypothetical protein
LFLIFFKYTKYIKKTDRIKTRTSAINAPIIRAKGIKLATNVKKNKVSKCNFFLKIIFCNMNILSQMCIAEIKQKKNYIIILIILLSWAHQWLSIGSFINTDYKNFTLNYILQYRNQSLAIFVINLFIFFFNNTKKIKNNIFFYFCLIPTTYLLGLVNLFIDTPSEKDIYFFWHFTFILQMINTLLIINNFCKIQRVDDAILLKINLIILFIYTVAIFTEQNFYLKVEYYINFWDFKIVTNSNGISRILSMINIFITCNYFMKKRNMIVFFLIFIINFMIISMESRQGVLLILVQLLLIIFYYSKKNQLIKKILKYLIMLIIIPICLSFIYKNNSKNRLFLFQGELKQFQLESENKNILKDLKNYMDQITTGRLDKWKISLNHIINSDTKNLLFGNGPEFDRKIIQTKGNDVANGMIYIILCGGVMGLFFFFIIIKKILYIIFNAFCNKEKFNKDVYFCFSICCIISLTLRTLVENGFLVYGVDFLLAISSFFYAAKKLKLI